MQEVLISAKNIEKKFNKNIILKDVSLDINKGEVIALVGPNGSGKTTLINILLGILKADKGELKINIEDYKKHIGLQLQSTPFFEGYNVKDNILMFSALYDIKMSDEEIESILNKYNLNPKTPAIKLSGGEQKKLAIMIATMQNPDLLIFDEPTASLDPRERYNIKNMILELAKNNKTILFTSHDLEEVEDIASKIVFLYKGEILEKGSKEELLKKYNFDSLEKVYLHITNY
ncbi:ABC transporter ATP-binding protein [Brachyspira pilosicoli]|uniref:ABC transporter related protein n=1 Tax=Brachyspira pilosicoli (strain ATCC BAA-1826 / 95/1000) TaxID=759914 RepID=D8ICN9_BRAP9|nr:ABC transporter ATP-binding protein [Brachyspira pilosicoli]ADK30912.1 ABC transporter related protein [Brachyspira pilosicoli 95/1000]WIH83282.1 ABC transporter ATP-binding protein [Brachyspira pilosicoli]WIH85514.1 ABC transporter ATP-binding protein [Brachyspira pilosicoli]SUW04830.1 ABC transporter-like protein [Brachyspira pilosicoli]SUW09297.1 ABC transporter-like protein [Brachyspira pilosicoli]